MEDLEKVITPIAGLWAAHQSMFSSAGFLNGMRETVITGKHEDRLLTKAHSDAIHFDWKLSMAATILVCTLFAVLIATSAFTWAEDIKLRIALLAVASYPGTCAFLFVLCGFSDSKVMLEAIAAREKNGNNAGQSPQDLSPSAGSSRGRVE